MCQNVSNEVLLGWFKFKAKIPSRFRVCVQWEWQKYTPPSSPLSKDERLRDIGHSRSIGNLILGVSRVTVSYLIHYDSLLQNATDIITKCDSDFITKCDRSLSQNETGFLLATKCDSFYKLRRYYYKMRQLLEIAIVQYASLILVSLKINSFMHSNTLILSKNAM